jgi:hypothetical protein
MNLFVKKRATLTKHGEDSPCLTQHIRVCTYMASVLNPRFALNNTYLHPAATATATVTTTEMLLSPQPILFLLDGLLSRTRKRLSRHGGRTVHKLSPVNRADLHMDDNGDKDHISIKYP